MVITRYLIFWLVLLIAIPDGFVRGQTPTNRSKSVPSIESFSKTEFAIYKGDRVRLKVQANGPDLVFRWMRASGILCEEATCLIDSGDWGFGRHTVSFVVFNQYGSLFLRYSITVLNPPWGYKASELEAPLIEEKRRAEQVSWVDFVVFSMRGKGYSYHDSKVQVIGEESRILDWNETLRAQMNSDLRFGRPQEESHVLFDSGVVHLAQSSPERRAIILTRGSIRSRQLRAEMPRYSILVADGGSQDGSQKVKSGWVQIDGDSQSDFAILRHETGEETPNDSDQKSGATEQTLSEANAVSIQVYQGNVRVFLQTGAFGEGEALYVPAGFEIEIEKPDMSQEEVKNPKVDVFPLRVRKMNRILKETSPEYIFASDFGQNAHGWTLERSKQNSPSLKEALGQARLNLKENNFFGALEQISPHWKKYRDEKSLRAVAAEIYARLGWYDQVLNVFNESMIKEDQVEFKTLVHLGILELLDSRWEKAYRTLSMAKNRVDSILGKIPDPWEIGLLEYYLGYAAYRSGDYLSAEKAFTEVEENKVIHSYLRDSAQGLRRQSTARKIWDLSFGLGLGYDSNVLHANQAELSRFYGGKFGKNRSWSLISAFNTSAWAYRNLDGHIGVQFDFKRIDYAEPALKDIAPLDQELGIATAFKLGLDEVTKNAWIEMGSDFFMGMRYVGEERALDFMRGTFLIGSPRLLNTNVQIEKKIMLDPLPLRDDFFDPELEELSLAGDRGRRLTSVILSIEPYHLPQSNIGLKLGRDTVDFSDENLTFSNHREMKSEIYGNFVHPKKIFSSFLIRGSNRVFSEQELRKNDKKLGLKLSLGVKDILFLTHRMSYSFTRRSTPMESLEYKRHLYEYMATIDF